MKRYLGFVLAALVGAVCGAAAVSGLYAQAKPPAFVVAEIDLNNPEAFVKEYSPLAVKAVAAGAGYKAIARGGKTVSIEGAEPKSRIVINRFDSLDEAVKVYNSAEYKKAREVGNKYGTFRIYATEGLPQ